MKGSREARVSMLKTLLYWLKAVSFLQVRTHRDKETSLLNFKTKFTLKTVSIKHTLRKSFPIGLGLRVFNVVEVTRDLQFLLSSK
jgi:hypothetical protein